MDYDSTVPGAYGITSAIGNTPLVKLQRVVPQGCADIYIKLEYFNPTGSYKDRMALSIIEEAEKRGDLKPGMTVVECTGGSTGTSLAFVCAAKGYHFKAVSSAVFAKEKLQSIKLFGAELELVSSDDGKINARLIPQMIKIVEEMNQQDDIYWTQQFTNTDALIGYSQLGHEVVRQLDKPIHTFCAAVGTAGMYAGVSAALKQHQPDIKLTILEPASSPIISKGIKGTHTVEGIGTGFIPPLLSSVAYDEVLAIEEAEARAMARALAATEGIFAGISTGLNVVAAIQVAERLGPGHTVLTVACDSGMKYLAGNLFG